MSPFNGFRTDKYQVPGSSLSTSNSRSDSGSSGTVEALPTVASEISGLTYALEFLDNHIVILETGIVGPFTYQDIIKQELNP